jgi:hypothetical protein
MEDSGKDPGYPSIHMISRFFPLSSPLPLLLFRREFHLAVKYGGRREGPWISLYTYDFSILPPLLTTSAAIVQTRVPSGQNYLSFYPRYSHPEKFSSTLINIYF